MREILFFVHEGVFTREATDTEGEESKRAVKYVVFLRRGDKSSG